MAHGAISNSDLTGAQLGLAVPYEVNFSGSGARLHGCDLRGANLAHARLETTQFHTCNLRQASFAGPANSVRFVECHLGAARLEGIRGQGCAGLVSVRCHRALPFARCTLAAMLLELSDSQNRGSDSGVIAMLLARRQWAQGREISRCLMAFTLLGGPA